MLIIFTESVLLYHFKGFILEIKTQQYKKERSSSSIVTMVPNVGLQFWEEFTTASECD